MTTPAEDIEAKIRELSARHAASTNVVERLVLHEAIDRLLDEREVRHVE